jgi:hypothetical protein
MLSAQVSAGQDSGAVGQSEERKEDGQLATVLAAQAREQKKDAARQT